MTKRLPERKDVSISISVRVRVTITLFLENKNGKIDLQEVGECNEEIGTRVGQIHGEKTYLTVSKRVHVSVNRQTCHCTRYKEILDGYDDFKTYVIVGLSRVTTNFGR